MDRKRHIRFIGIVPMSENENEGLICTECSEYFKNEEMARNHAEETNHLDYSKGFIDEN